MITNLILAEKRHKKILNLNQNNTFFPTQSGTGTIPKVEKKNAGIMKIISKSRIIC
jgi:hypothetical protein